MPAPTPSQAALLVHGLGGTRYDLGSLHKILGRAGLDTHGLTLPGHGGQPEHLLPVSAEDWLEALRVKYRELLECYDTVHLIGMCMGALLALELAKQEHHVRGRLVVLAPPVFLDGWSTPWYRDLRHLLYRLPLVARKIKVAEEEPFGVKNELMRAMIKARFAQGHAFHYPWVPLACVQQVDRLREWVMRGLAEIRCPTLIVHAREDELTSLRSARFLVDHLPAALSNLVVLENSYHMICVDNDRRRVAVSILEHLGLDPAHARKGPRDRD